MKNFILKTLIIVFGILSIATLLITRYTPCDDVTYTPPECEDIEDAIEQLNCSLKHEKPCISTTLAKKYKPVLYVFIATTIVAIVTEFTKSQKIKLASNILSLAAAAILIVIYISADTLEEPNLSTLTVFCFLIYALALIINIIPTITKLKRKNTRK